MTGLDSNRQRDHRVAPSGGPGRPKRRPAAVAIAAVCAATLLALLGSAAQAAAIPPGERDVKVLIARWSDQEAYPFTAQQLRDAVFEEVAGDPAENGSLHASGFFEEVSDDAASLAESDPIEQVPSTLESTDGEVTGCDVSAVTADMRAQAGITAEDFDHVIHITPRMPCPGSGFASIPGRLVFLNGTIIWRLVAHELTHNLDAAHAGACEEMLPNGDCNANSYGDPFDIMGASTGSLAGFPSAWHLAQIGAIDREANTMEVDADGIYELIAANDAATTTGAKLLGIPRGEGAEWPLYALETRIRRPYDDFLDPAARLYNGVTVRLATIDASTETAIVPASPGSSPATNPRNWPLLACEVYTDGQVSIRPLEVDAGSAQVQVALEGRPLEEHPACGSSPGEPDLRVTAAPRLRRVGAGRRQVSYTLRARNAGEGQTGPVRLCAAGPKRRIRIAGPRCVTRRIPPAERRVRRVRVRIKRAARGKLTKIRMIANGPSIERQRRVVRLRVRR